MSRKPSAQPADSRFPAISVRQPWADLIVLGEKDIENRSWSTGFRGPILVHASQGLDWDGVETEASFLQKKKLLTKSTPMSVPGGWEYHSEAGAIIGMVDIVDCVREHDSYYFEGPFGFVLQNAKVFKRPIPWRGAVGIFYVPRAELRGTPAFRAKPGGTASSARMLRSH